MDASIRIPSSFTQKVMDDFKAKLATLKAPLDDEAELSRLRKRLVLLTVENQFLHGIVHTRETRIQKLDVENQALKFNYEELKNEYDHRRAMSKALLQMADALNHDLTVKLAAKHDAHILDLKSQSDEHAAIMALATEEHEGALVHAKKISKLRLQCQELNTEELIQDKDAAHKRELDALRAQHADEIAALHAQHIDNIEAYRAEQAENRKLESDDSDDSDDDQ
jgi:hypothetical protein